MDDPAALPLTFEDVAIYFSEPEWENLEAWQKELYKHVMRTNYETLVSLDNGLPKPELISWIEHGRVPFRSWGESQRLGNVIPSSAHVHFDPVSEGNLLGGSQQAVQSGKTKCHSQWDALQSKHSFGPFSGERDSVSSLSDEGISLLDPLAHDAQAPAALIPSSSESSQRDGIPGCRALLLPGLQEASSGPDTRYSVHVCGESFWKQNHLAKHHSPDAPHGARRTFSKQAVAQQQWNGARAQSHLPCLECGKSFLLKPDLLRHRAAHTRKNRFQSPKCKMCFPHEHSLSSHDLVPKEEKPSQDPKGDKSFFPVDGVQVYQRQSTGERPASQRGGSRAHSEQKPGPGPGCEGHCHSARDGEALCGGRGQGEGRPCSCPARGSCLLSRPRLAGACSGPPGETAFQRPERDRHVHESGLPRAHPRVQGGDRLSSCRKCGQGFSAARRGGESALGCAQCGRPFRVRRHQRRPKDELRFGRRAGEKPFSCGQCGRAFAHRCKLREHLRVHSGERPFQCPECPKRFRLKGVLKAHERTHSAQRPFSCAECGKGFIRQSRLTEHFRVHSGEKPFPCPQCERSFRLRGQLLSHQRLHTGERPFQCPECGKSYRVKADMKVHQLLHGGAMPFSCECGKGFAKQSKLVEHVRTHTGEKPFQCPQCDKRFRLKAQLLSHQGLHTGKRPFHCPECDKNFRERGHMLRHQRIHRPERPFACGECGKGFIYKSKLAEHVRVHAKSCRGPREPDRSKKRLSQLFAMIEADWS